MKKRLMQLLEECSDKLDEKFLACETCEEQFKLWWSDVYAEHLINNGVLVPPCKVGDKIYFLHEAQEGVDGWIDEGTVVSIFYDDEGFDFRAVYNSGLTFWHTINDKMSFFKKEEAERALKKKREVGNE